MSASNQTETIDAYLLGELDPAELASFEARLESDPVLAEEYAFQKNVFEGIQHSRKLALKNRLAQVDVAGTTTSGQSGLLKVAGGVLLAGVLGFATYQFWPMDNSRVIKEYGPYETAFNPESFRLVLPEGVTEASKVTPKVSTKKSIEAVPKETIDAAQPAIAKPISQETTESVADLETPDELFKPQVALPEDDGDVASTEFVPEELSETFSNTLETKEIDALNIERLDEKSKKLRYRYYDGKLALFGDFGDSPYQILEINQKEGGKEVFLLHNDAFYRLRSTKAERPLRPITDPALLSELQIFQEKK